MFLVTAAGDEWHLRKTDWYGEPAQVLDAVDWSLEKCRIENGHQLLLVVGMLPPHGFFRLPVWLVNTPASAPSEPGDESVLAWITNSIHSKAILLTKQCMQDLYLSRNKDVDGVFVFFK